MLHARHRLLDSKGISLIEVMIVVIIVGILMAVAIPSFTTSKRTARKRTGVATAVAFQDAIDAFTRAHGSRPPAAMTADWPASGSMLDPRGPRNADGNPYLKGGAPESVEPDKVVKVGSAPMTNPPVHDLDRQDVYLEYSASGLQWYLKVWIRSKPGDPKAPFTENGKNRPHCTVSNGLISDKDTYGPAC